MLDTTTSGFMVGCVCVGGVVVYLGIAMGGFVVVVVVVVVVVEAAAMAAAVEMAARRESLEGCCCCCCCCMGFGANGVCFCVLLLDMGILLLREQSKGE